MPSGYHHLTIEERTRIECYGQLGWSQSAIAEQLGRHRSTISRELLRNSVGLCIVLSARFRAYDRFE